MEKEGQESLIKAKTSTFNDRDYLFSVPAAKISICSAISSKLLSDLWKQAIDRYVSDIDQICFQGQNPRKARKNFLLTLLCAMPAINIGFASTFK